MGDPKGFLTTPREAPTRRPVDLRLQGLARGLRGVPRRPAGEAGRALHELRHPVLPPGLSAGQPHPGVERPRLPRRVARGDRAAARHEQLPGVHRDAVPGAVRGRLRAGDQQRRGDDQAGRAADRSTTRGTRAGSSPQPAGDQTGKKVAVVGSGPAGLAAAQQLTRVGHDVTVFERADRIGGLLRYGIPEFKMEKFRLDRRLAQMEAEGTVFRPGVERRHGHHRRAAAGPSSTRSCSPAAPPRPATCPRPGREFDGHLPGDGVPAVGEPRAAGRPGRAADHRRGQARGDRRRRRHRRRLPRHRAPAGRGVGHPAGDHADPAGEADREHALADLPDGLPGGLGARGGRRAALRGEHRRVHRRRRRQRRDAEARRGHPRRERPVRAGGGHRAGDPGAAGAARDGLRRAGEGPAARGAGRGARRARQRRARRRTS